MFSVALRAFVKSEKITSDKVILDWAWRRHILNKMLMVQIGVWSLKDTDDDQFTRIGGANK